RRHCGGVPHHLPDPCSSRLEQHENVPSKVLARSRRLFLAKRNVLGRRNAGEMKVSGPAHSRVVPVQGLRPVYLLPTPTPPFRRKPPPEDVQTGPLLRVA